jgi:dihydrofolate reductase
MRKLIAAINMTLDGFCDHTAVIPDDEMHRHYSELLSSADAIIFGRITYQLMEYWSIVVKNPTGKKPIDEFAVIIDKIDKIVFSHTLKNSGWNNTRIVNRDLKEEVMELRQQPGRDILVGSRSLIVSLMKLNLIDELQLCVHPVIAGKGLPLFSDINDRTVLKLLKTKKLNFGAVIFYYSPGRE